MSEENPVTPEPRDPRLLSTSSTGPAASRADDEPTTALPPHQDEPTTALPPHADPEPTIAMPVTEPEQPFRAPAYEAPADRNQPREPYVRGPVFTPTGFDQPQGTRGPHGDDRDDDLAPTEEFALPRQEHGDSEQDRQTEAERRRRAAEDARNRSLGTIIPADDGTDVARLVPPRRTTDKWFASMGLFLLRWALAAILAVRGYQMITDIPGTRDLLGEIGMPWLEYFPWALAIAHGLAALGLVFGLGVRVIGLCVAALGISVLAVVKWGVVPIFQSGMPGFVGELEVLMTAVGFALFTLGSGGWGMDAGLRHNRQRDRFGEA